MKTKSTIKVIIVISVIILVLVGITILQKFVDSGNRAPENDPNLIGNTQGNLYNGGYFTQKDDIIYFSNAYDGGSIYSMTATEGDVKKIVSGKTSFLNIAGDYIYYYSSTSGEQTGLGYIRNGRGFFRSSLDGKKTFTLAKAETDSMILVGNHLYFTNFEEDPSNPNQALVTIHSITLNNEDDKMLIKQHAKLGGYSNGNIYYSGIDNDHYLYSYNIGTGATNTVFNEYVYLPIVYGGYVYYLDLNDEYKLKKYSLADQSITTIVDERVDTYNLYNDIIYYQNVDPNGYALKRIYTDGTGLETVKEGVFTNINITSHYVYFNEFKNEVPIYHTPTFGNVNVTAFTSAMEAVTAK